MLAGHSQPLVAIVGHERDRLPCVVPRERFAHHDDRRAPRDPTPALAITVALATVFTELAHFSGTVDEESLLLKFGATTIDLEGLLLAGMVLGALGALDDVTVTQAAAVGELHAPRTTAATRRELYRSGLRVGRERVASTVNTLALAYAGAALPILILFSLSGRSLGAVANGEIVAVAIVAALVGSIGLVCAVPISTSFAALVATGQPGQGSPAPQAASERPGPGARPRPARVGPRRRRFLGLVCDVEPQRKRHVDLQVAQEERTLVEPLSP